MTADALPISLPHRRVRAAVDGRLERLGADACDDEELVAILLGAGPAARRTARRLLDRFGSLGGLAMAHPAELRLAGVASSSAPRVVAAAELGRRLARTPPSDPWLIRTPADAAEPLVDAMGSLEREELRVLLLDTKNVVTAQRDVYRGNLAGSSVRVGEVFRDAVRACAAAIIVAHNHPSGDPAPSGEDLRITTELADAGRLLDIELLDHLVIGRGRWTSLRALGALGQSSATMR
ncbi:MAG TPA: DNA repair protein RadC [Candidatus Limnocylindrales bacterium]|nr:DNA repair protein RadC [Candidatus Limnocylindrales bacterium]